MILGFPKEILDNETRVAVIPATVKQYIDSGLIVKVESGAGLKSQISDSDYSDVGAEIVDSALNLFSSSDMILKVNSPNGNEIEMMKNGSSYISFFQTMKETDKVIALQKKKYHSLFNASYSKDNISTENGCIKLSNKHFRI